MARERGGTGQGTLMPGEGAEGSSTQNCHFGRCQGTWERGRSEARLPQGPEMKREELEQLSVLTSPASLALSFMRYKICSPDFLPVAFS